MRVYWVSEKENLSYVNRGEVGSNYPRSRDEAAQMESEFERSSGDSRRSGNYGRKRNMNRSRPVELGKEYDVEIIEKSRRFDGIAKIDGFVIFVRNVKVGDKPKIKIDSVSENFAIGSPVEQPQPAVEAASPAAEKPAQAI
jgi:predicted RNA-binding protein with TRAM domain